MRRKRNRKATKRADLAALKEVMKDNRVWCALGIVLADDSGSAHFEINGGEVLVDVELQPSLEEVSAIVSTPLGGNGSGVWSVPPVGSEVIVAVPDGEFDFQPTIVGVMNGGGGVDGLSASTLVIVAPPGGKVLIHDGNGDAEPLVRKSDFEVHTHPTGTGPSGPPDPASTPDPFTKVLEGK